MNRFVASVMVGLILCSAAFGGDSIAVNITAVTVDGVDLTQCGPELEAKLGSRVVKATEMPEGDPSDLWVISFGGHRIFRHWNGISFTDAVFRTKEGLGVGSTVRDFEKVYGESVLSEAEGCRWFFKDPAVRLALESDDCEPDKQQKVPEVRVRFADEPGRPNPSVKGTQCAFAHPAPYVER